MPRLRIRAHACLVACSTCMLTRHVSSAPCCQPDRPRTCMQAQHTAHSTKESVPHHIAPPAHRAAAQCAPSTSRPQHSAPQHTAHLCKLARLVLAQLRVAHLALHAAQRPGVAVVGAQQLLRQRDHRHASAAVAALCRDHLRHAKVQHLWQRGLQRQQPGTGVQSWSEQLASNKTARHQPAGARG